MEKQTAAAGDPTHFKGIQRAEGKAVILKSEWARHQFFWVPGLLPGDLTEATPHSLPIGSLENLCPEEGPLGGVLNF